MQNTSVKPRVLTSLLVLAAVVALALVLLFTLRSKADEPEGEFANFGFQTLSALDLAGDADTDVRFLFTVGSLAYDEVGFVFSKTNPTPTIGGYGCGKKAAANVYSSVLAGGTPNPAPDGRWWVAIKMTDIPHAYFDGPLYVRPYVDDGEIRYGEAKVLTVCSAAEHVHDSQLFPGCEGCNLEDAKEDVGFYNASDKASGDWDVRETYKNIRGTDYFRPHNTNGMQGNDLLIEFSILWNESLADCAGSALDIGVNNGSDIANIYLTGANAGKIAAKERTGTTYIYPTPAEIAADSSRKYVSLGEYGWHRLGFRVHQEAAIVADAVQYTYIITVYLDGEVVLKYDSSAWATSTSGARLFNASITNEVLTYSNNDSNSCKANTTIVDFYAGSDNYLVIADEYMTCGKDFVQDVVRDNAPEAATLVLSGDDDLPAERWFELKGWKNETFLNANEKDSGTWDVRETYKNIRGTDYFRPHNTNGMQGNDLLIEFSILWNESLADCAGSALDIGVNNGSDIANIYLTGANAGKIAAKERTGTTYIYPTPAEIAADSSRKYVSLGEYGWHRLGFRVHQEAAIVADAVQYTYIITVYLDGEVVLKYDSSAWATSTSGARLFNASITNEVLTYSDNDSNSCKANTTIVDFYAGSDNYLVIADEYMTCGKEFVQDVVKVVSPVARTTTLGGNDCSAKLWYQRQFTDGKTVLNSSDKASGDWDERPTFATIQGEQHFYPDASNGNLGNDLLIEFSILWNDTMATVYGANSTFDIGVNNGSDLANIDLQSATSGNFSAKERTGTTYVFPTEPEDRHPNIGSNGWHRVGVRVHQEAAIVDDAVQYTYLITVYLDGEMILKYDSSAWATSTPGALLFTATIEDGNLVYADNANASAKANITIANYYKGSGNYLVIADEYMTCGREFVRQVKPVVHPTAVIASPIAGVGLRADTWYARTSGPIQAGNYTHTGFRSSDYLTVMSYNIEKYDGGWDGRDPAKAIQTILDASPDIAGLQEVNGGWNGSIATLTSNGYARISGDTTTDNWPELFYKTARFTNLNSGYKRYSALASEFPGVDKNGADTSRDNQGRLFTWARLEDKITGKKILAISTHLHYRVDQYDTASSDENTLVRRYEIRLLLAWIADQSFEYDAVVVVGDMNEHYLNTKGKATTNIFRESGFGVARDVAAIKGDTGGTMTKSGRSKRDGLYNFDLILLRGNVEATYYTVADNKTDNAGTSYSSDHVPILTEFRFR